MPKNFNDIDQLDIHRVLYLYEVFKIGAKILPYALHN